MLTRYLTLALMIGAVIDTQAQSSCATALPITPGIHDVASLNGEVPDAPRCANHDQGAAAHAVWYSYTATNDTIVQITTDVMGHPQVDTRFHVYTGPCTALTCVVGNDNGGINGTSRASFDALEGETYYIVFDDRWSTTAFSFELSEEFWPVGNMESYTSFMGSFMNISGNPMGVVDMNNDGLDDALAVTQTAVSINEQLADGGYTARFIPTDNAQYPASWSLCAGDLDGNGHKDLLYGGQYGVTFMMASDDGLGYIQQAGPEYVFSQRSNMVDINNDGHLDAFVCHDVAPNVAFINNGLGMLTFTQGGYGWSGGNYGSIWVDYDNDGDMDLYVAKCGSDPNDILMRNDGNGQFASVTGPMGTPDYHQSWSSAWGDYDNDGDLDVLVGSSTSLDHRLMRNDGAGTFTNVTAGSGMDQAITQGIEWATHDFNNDGLLDILGAGTVAINLGDMRFGWNNQSPGPGAVGDLNNDGSLDVYGNFGCQLGVPNGNHWTRILLHGTVSNSDGIGARITVQSALGSQIREVRSGDGFRYMSSIMPHFGLGSDDLIERITVRWPSGTVQELENLAVDQLIEITEPLGTAVVATKVTPELQLYPNPATDRLWFKGAIDQGVSVRITDLTGRVVGQEVLMAGGLSVAHLKPGLYTVRVSSAGTPVELRFRKE